MINGLLEAALVMSVLGSSWIVLTVSSGIIKAALVEEAFIPVKGRLPRHRGRQ